MLRSLYISLVYGIFLCAGIVAPFALALGYVWVDNFTPQRVVYSILTDLPVSEIMAVACVVAYVATDRRSPPRPNMVSALCVLMLLWVTYTTFFEAVAPELAIQKWNWASKTILFSLFMPALFRSRTQIEAFLQVYVFSLGSQFLPFAVKTLLSGGGYGKSFGLVAGNSGLSEGSTLATACTIAAIFCLYLARYQTILPGGRLVRLGFYGLAAACIIAGVGTYERTALIGAAVVAATLWWQSRRKLLYAVLLASAVVAFGFYLATSQSDWAQRMATTSNVQESSTLGRILVWRWTLDFVRSHPFGGGFYAYVVDTVVFPATADNPGELVIHGKAFHSIYFEMLGENGWPGLALFLGIAGASFWSLWRVRRQAMRMAGMEWLAALASSAMAGLVALLTCGVAISIAFLPETYYVFALAVMLGQHMRGVLRQQRLDAAKEIERARRLAAGDAVPDAGADWGGALA